jgi:hypothetical protein
MCPETRRRRVEEARLWRWVDARESRPGTREDQRGGAGAGAGARVALALALTDDSDGSVPKCSVGSRVPVRRQAVGSVPCLAVGECGKGYGAWISLARGLAAIARRLRPASARAQRSTAAPLQQNSAQLQTRISHAEQRITRPVVACARLLGSRSPPGGSMRCGICSEVRSGAPVSCRRRQARNPEGTLCL